MKYVSKYTCTCILGLGGMKSKFPTQLKFSFIDNEDMDGMSHWDAIQNLEETKRTEFIYNLDDMNPPVTGHAAIRYALVTIFLNIEDMGDVGTATRCMLYYKAIL